MRIRTPTGTHTRLLAKPSFSQQAQQQALNDLIGRYNQEAAQTHADQQAAQHALTGYTGGIVNYLQGRAPAVAGQRTQLLAAETPA